MVVKYSVFFIVIKSYLIANLSFFREKNIVSIFVNLNLFVALIAAEKNSSL